MSLADVLKPLDEIFRECGVRYALIGGYAVAAWGEERATRDIDILCSSGASGAVMRALNQRQFQFRHHLGDPDDPIEEVVRVAAGPVEDPAEVDILFGIRESPPGILDRTRPVRLEGLAVPTASPEDMIILKLLGGSARDLEDAGSIIDIQGNRLDRFLLRELCPDRLRATLDKLIRSAECRG